MRVKLSRDLLSALFFVIVSFDVSSYAQVPSATSTPPLIPASTPAVSPQPNPELVALRGQVELIREYNERILNTVYWALGGMLTVLTLIVGFGWYANFRSYKRDVEELQSHFKREFEEIKKSYKSDIDTLKQTAMPELRKEISSLIDSKMHSLNHQLNELKYGLLEAQLADYVTKGVHANALTVSLNMIDVALQIGYDWKISLSINHLAKAIKAGGMKYSGDARTIINVVNALPADYKEEAELIRQLVRAAREEL